MKKLKVKIFAIIFFILSFFLIGVFVISTIREYKAEINSIEDVLNRDKIKFNDIHNMPTNNPKEIFLDYTIYTIVLDDEGNYKDIVNHTKYDSIDEESVKAIANDIIEENNQKHVSNLIFDNYSYSFNKDNTLTIIDNSSQTNKMRSYFITSFVGIILLEIVAYFIAKYLSKWVTDPVNESFEREKRFIGDASHELKTPISVIMASVDAYNNDKDKKWINNIKNESERMSNLVTNLLDLTKLENDKDIVKAKQDLSRIVEGSILTFESLFYEHKLKLEYNITKKIMFNCNQESIKELVGILVDNAIKYSDAKSKVVVNLKKKDKNIVLEVTNTGTPIADENKEKIFERFFKVDESRNRKNNNYGLGLSIAKRIVELHEGSITANSVGKLTTFKIIWSQK